MEINCKVMMPRARSPDAIVSTLLSAVPVNADLSCTAVVQFPTKASKEDTLHQ